MVVKTFYIGKSLDNPLIAILIFQGSKNVLYDILIKTEIKEIVEASGHIYESTRINCCI